MRSAGTGALAAAPARGVASAGLADHRRRLRGDLGDGRANQPRLSWPLAESHECAALDSAGASGVRGFIVGRRVAWRAAWGTGSESALSSATGRNGGNVLAAS